MGICSQLQQRNCSRFARDSLHRIAWLNSQRTGGSVEQCVPLNQGILLSFTAEARAVRLDRDRKLSPFEAGQADRRFSPTAAECS
jgi:hypothetical protein